jgi:hypothetical protein
MEQLVQRLPLAVSLSTALAFVLSVIYDLAFFASFHWPLFQMMTISDHVTSVLDFLAQFVIIVSGVICYILVFEGILKAHRTPRAVSFINHLEQYRGRFRLPAKLLYFFLIWQLDATRARWVILFLPCFTLVMALSELYGGKYLNTADLPFALAVGTTLVLIGLLSLTAFVFDVSSYMRYVVTGVIAVNVFVWPATLGSRTAGRLIADPKLFYITTIPSCKIERSQLAVSIIRSIERGLIVMESNIPSGERIITWSCIASLQAGANA